MREFFGLKLLVAASMLGSSSAAVLAQTSLPTGHNPDSEYSIRYDDYNLILQASVLDVGPSDRKPASRSDSRTVSTRVKDANMAVTAFEGNRVLYSEFGEGHVENLLAIRKDLEAVAEFTPLEEFARMEQLAYWYNLHNVAVMYEIAKAYPFKKLDKLQTGKNNVWDAKSMSIGGVPTSIRDIEEHVVSNWNNPIVLYGFYMGAIGGPNIRTEAYTRDNVVESLQDNAIRFVNSLRGFRLWSRKGRVSDHYKLGARFFPNFQEDIASHLTAYARPSTRRDIAKAKSFQIKNYDWAITDTMNGSVDRASSFNKSSGALVWFLESPNPQTASPVGGAAPTTVGVLDGLGNNAALTAQQSSKVSMQTRALLRAMKIRNEKRLREGEVTVEEFVGEDEEEGSRVVRRKTLEEIVEADDGDDGGQLTE